ALDPIDPSMLVNFRSRFHGRTCQPRNIARRIAPRADLIHHAAKIYTRPDFRAQLASLHHAQLVIELDLNDLCLPLVIVEMLLLASDFQMTAARKVARDPFYLDDLLNAIERSQRRR